MKNKGLTNSTPSVTIKVQRTKGKVKTMRTYRLVVELNGVTMTMYTDAENTEKAIELTKGRYNEMQILEIF